MVLAVNLSYMCIKYLHKQLKSMRTVSECHVLQFQKVIFTTISEELIKKNVGENESMQVSVIYAYLLKTIFVCEIQHSYYLKLKTIPPTSLKANKLKISVFAADHKFQLQQCLGLTSLHYL